MMTNTPETSQTARWATVAAMFRDLIDLMLRAAALLAGAAAVLRKLHTVLLSEAYPLVWKWLYSLPMALVATVFLVLAFIAVLLCLDCLSKVFPRLVASKWLVPGLISLCFCSVLFAGFWDAMGWLD